MEACMSRAFILVAGVCLLAIVMVRLGSAGPAPAPSGISAAQASPTPAEYCFAEWPDTSATPVVGNEGAFRDTVGNTLLNNEMLSGIETEWALHLNRILIERGGSSPVSCYPPMVLYVESGTLEIRLYVGTAIVVRGAVQGGDVDEMHTGTPEDPAIIRLEPGDSIALQDAIFSLHNPGWDDVVFVAASFQPDDFPCPCLQVP
jgi:hypothetical protein